MSDNCGRLPELGGTRGRKLVLGLWGGCRSLRRYERVTGTGDLARVANAPESWEVDFKSTVDPAEWWELAKDIAADLASVDVRAARTASQNPAAPDPRGHTPDGEH